MDTAVLDLDNTQLIWVIDATDGRARVDQMNYLNTHPLDLN